MMTLQLGDFTCIPISGETGKLIEIGEYLNGDGFKNYEHAEVLVDSAHTMGAYPGGAHLSSLPAVQWQKGWLWSSDAIGKNLTIEHRRVIVGMAMNLIDVPYSPADYFAIAAHRLNLPGAFLLKNYVASSHHLICSQLVDFCYMKAGVHLFNDGRWPGYVTPEDLANVILDPSGVTYD